MTLYRQKDIKELVKLGIAIDMSHYSVNEISALKDRLKLFGLSVGVNGLNGLLFRDHNIGQWYAVIGCSKSQITCNILL